MSYTTWHNYGYGICVSNIKIDVDRVKRLISMSPELDYEFEKDSRALGYDINSEDFDERMMEDVFEYMELQYGLASVIETVIFDVEGVRMTACDDFNCNDYVILPASLPWGFNEKEICLTEAETIRIFRKYIKILTDEDVEVCWRSVENGG